MFAIDFVARSGGGLNEIDLKIYFHTYNVKKMKSKEQRQRVGSA